MSKIRCFSLKTRPTPLSRGVRYLRVGDDLLRHSYIHEMLFDQCGRCNYKNCWRKKKPTIKKPTINPCRKKCQVDAKCDFRCPAASAHHAIMRGWARPCPLFDI